MNYIPMIFSLAFFITFGLYLFLGIYTIHLNPKALTHKVFLVLTVTLCLWSIGFSMMNIVNNPDSALLWGRVSAAGWSTMYSILVFFLLLLFNPSFLKKNKIVSVLIHIPAAIILYVFSISDTMARAQYDLVKIGYGWKDISINNIWNYLFYVYYIGYMIGALVLLWRWKKRSNEESVHKQANLIFYSMLIALVLGTASDVVLINIAPDISIQMAPIWILLPIAAIYYSIRKYSFLGTKESNEEEKILDSKTRARLNYYVAIIFYLGSMLAFLARYFPNTIKNPIIMKNTLTISVVLFVMGSTVLLLQLLKWQNIGDFLIISVVLLSIPVIILSFIQNSSITVWSIPLVLMIVSLVFNSRVPLILITIMSIITQVIVWIYGPIGSANILSNGLSKVNTEKKIEYMAYFDHLTGLPNRILFEDRLEQAIQLAKRNAKFLGVMFMDLDGFKVVNDTMGHSGGDKLLKAVARGLVSVLRKTDTVARFGGDEFMILINNIDEQKYVEVVAGNIKKLFEKPFLIDGQEYFITGSSGVAIYPIDGEDAETLNKNADIAMFRAKTRGKNQYALCTEDMKEEVKKNMILSNYLYRAQERNELVLHYQPQIKLSTGEIQGFEALIRWEHPELGTISPGVFIPLAEKMA